MCNICAVGQKGRKKVSFLNFSSKFRFDIDGRFCRWMIWRAYKYQANKWSDLLRSTENKCSRLNHFFVAFAQFSFLIYEGELHFTLLEKCLFTWPWLFVSSILFQVFCFLLRKIALKKSFPVISLYATLILIDFPQISPSDARRNIIFTSKTNSPTPRKAVTHDILFWVFLIFFVPTDFFLFHCLIWFSWFIGPHNKVHFPLKREKVSLHETNFTLAGNIFASFFFPFFTLVSERKFVHELARKISNFSLKFSTHFSPPCLIDL